MPSRRWANRGASIASICGNAGCRSVSPIVRRTASASPKPSNWRAASAGCRAILSSIWLRAHASRSGCRCRRRLPTLSARRRRGSSRSWRHDQPRNGGRGTRMIVRIYTGEDGQTHFEDLPPPAEASYNVPLQPGANLAFRCFPADYWRDWHTAPRRQYIFILAGLMEIGIGDGTTRRFGPGDVVLADDLTGQGHTTRSLGVPRISATVPVAA